MARDDWRVRVELEDAHGFLDRIGLDISAEAKDLARELAERRLTRLARRRHGVRLCLPRTWAEQARKVVEAELGELGLQPLVLRVEHWLTDDDRWDDEPDAPDIEEELAARGYAPWEVRVECASHDEADRLADSLEAEGYESSGAGRISSSAPRLARTRRRWLRASTARSKRAASSSGRSCPRTPSPSSAA